MKIPTTRSFRPHGDQVPPVSEDIGKSVNDLKGGDIPDPLVFRRRIRKAAVRQFVRRAQSTLPRDGPGDFLAIRRLVAKFARLERRWGAIAESNRSPGRPERASVFPALLCLVFPSIRFFYYEQFTL